MDKQSIFFICFGNICRSPFAERYAFMRSTDLGYSALSFDSAGVGASPGLPPTKVALDAAFELGVNLTSHRAKAMEQINPTPRDVLVCMDRYVFGVLAASLSAPIKAIKGPGNSRLMLMMHSLIGTDEGDKFGLDIPDPMGEGIVSYRKVYSLIVKAVDALLLKHNLGFK